MLLQVERCGTKIRLVLWVAALEKGTALRIAPQANVVLRGGLDLRCVTLHHARQSLVCECPSACLSPCVHERFPEGGLAPDIQEELPLVRAEILDAAARVTHRPEPIGAVAYVLHIPAAGAVGGVLPRVGVVEVQGPALEVEGQVVVPRSGVLKPAAPDGDVVGEGVAVDVHRELLQHEVPREAAKVEHLRQAAVGAHRRAATCWRWHSGPLVHRVHHPLDERPLVGRRPLRVDEREGGGRVAGADRRLPLLRPVDGQQVARLLWALRVGLGNLESPGGALDPFCEIVNA
mmetsp:Transcript_46559/g.133217  ORF Transcript_46559/g.133217 Transcript_46559/m.133217 type:complete len:290 (-) Transcript_46559:399-1268(-)